MFETKKYQIIPGVFGTDATFAPWVAKRRNTLSLAEKKLGTAR